MKFENIELIARNELTHDSAELVFDQVLDFEPGQYITIKADINGEEVHRSYSISSGKGEKLAVGVKRVANGKMSNFLNDLPVGTKVDVSEAEGRFTMKPGVNNLVLVAAGSGVTPMMSIVKDVKSQGKSVKLIYLNKTVNDVMYNDALADMLSGDELVSVYSREEVSGAYNGRLTDAVLSEIIANNNMSSADQVMLCGPKGMIDEASACFKAKGVSGDAITFELFFVDPTESTSSSSSTDTFDGEGTLQVVLDEETHTVKISGNETILDAALGEGIDVPYSCQGGVCSSCMCQVEQGDVVMRQNFTLTDGEVEDGMVLACQAEVKSSNVKVSFDI